MALHSRVRKGVMIQSSSIARNKRSPAICSLASLATKKTSKRAISEGSAPRSAVAAPGGGEAGAVLFAAPRCVNEFVFLAKTGARRPISLPLGELNNFWTPWDDSLDKESRYHLAGPSLKDRNEANKGCWGTCASQTNLSCRHVFFNWFVPGKASSSTAMHTTTPI